MLNRREGLRSFSLMLRNLCTCQAPGNMALYRRTADSCRLTQFSKANGHCITKRRFCADMGVINARARCVSALSLMSCLNRRDRCFRKGDDDMQKAQAVAPWHHQVIRDSVFFLEEDVGAKLAVGDEMRGNRSSLLFTDRSLLSKLIVAVDVDEADVRVHEFFKTSYFETGIHPIPGAGHVLHRLSTFCDLSVVTSRQNAIKDHTLNWLEQNYPGLFQEIHFGNHFALDGQSRPKSEICRTLGAQVLIDDNPRYALECAEVGIKVLLFDYHNSYPWCKTGSADSHPLVTKVHNRREIEQHRCLLVLVNMPS